MSLKKRAMQCSGYIPASQYVPAYSRPQRTSNSLWHEELSPITPKPTLDDSDSARIKSIHEAVKAWLESSPNSVISPLYRCRSPSGGCPASNVLSFDQTTAVPSRSSGDSSFDQGISTPFDMSINQALDVGSAVFSSVQKMELNAQPGIAQSSVCESAGSDITPQTDLLQSFANQILSQKLEHSVGNWSQAEVDSETNALKYVDAQHMYEVCDQRTRQSWRPSSTNLMEWRACGLMKDPDVVSEERQHSEKQTSTQHSEKYTNRVVFEKSKRDKIQARAVDPKNATLLNRYKREESKVHAWDEHKIVKATTAAFNKVEMKLLKQRAEATDKMVNDVIKTHPKADQVKASGEDRRVEKASKAGELAHLLRMLGKSPLSCFCS